MSQNTKQIIFARDYRLVQKYYERSQADKEEQHLYEQLKKWFEHKHKLPWLEVPVKTKGREL